MQGKCVQVWNKEKQENTHKISMHFLQCSEGAIMARVDLAKSHPDGLQLFATIPTHCQKRQRSEIVSIGLNSFFLFRYRYGIRTTDLVRSFGGFSGKKSNL